MKPCDVLVLAAVERVLHKYNAPNLRCKIVAEAANGPTTNWGEEICKEKNIKIIPDILLNSGSVIVSYFEWLKNIQHVEQGRMTKRWEEKSKKRFLKAIEDKLRAAGYNIDLQNLSKQVTRGVQELDITQTTIEYIVSEALHGVVHKALKEQCNLRIASYINALNRVDDAIRMIV